MIYHRSPIPARALLAVLLALGPAAPCIAEEPPAAQRPAASPAQPADDAARLAALERDGAAIAGLYGIPTPAQRDRARTLLADFTLPAASPNPARSEAHRLVRARLALIAASAFADDPAAAAVCIEAAERELASIRPEDPAPQTERFILLAAAELLAPAADPAAAGRAFDHLQDAKNVLRTNRAEGTPARTQLELTGATTIAALLERGPDAALRTIDRERNEFPFILDGHPDPLAQILAADLAARALVRRARESTSAPESRRSAINELCLEYESLALRDDLGIDPAALASLAVAKLGTLISTADAHPLLPSIGIAALVSAAPPADRDAAISAARAHLARPSARDAWQADIALSLADRLMENPDPAAQPEAASVLLDAAANLSTRDARLARTLALACAAAAASGDDALLARALRAAHESPADIPDRDALSFRYAQLLAADADGWAPAIAVLDSITPPAELAPEARRLAVGLAAGLALTNASAADIERLTAQVTRAEAELDSPEAPTWLDAAAASLALAKGDAATARERATAALLRAERAADLQTLRIATETAARAAIALGDAGALDPLLTRLAAREDGRPAAAVCALLAQDCWSRIAPALDPFPADAPAQPDAAADAAALLALSRWADASPAFEAHHRAALQLSAAHAAALIHDWPTASSILAADPPGGTDPAEWRLLRAEASLALGDDAAAFRELSPLARALDADPNRRPERWRAWTRVLEILDRQNTDGSRNPTIRRELTVLRAEDDWGSCAACAARLAPLVEKYLPQPTGTPAP